MPQQKPARGSQSQRQPAQSNIQRVGPQYRFINPYTFVPFPDEVKRTKPEGHDKLSPGNYSGRVTIDWTTITPLLLSPEWSEGDKVIMPGSSIKGAVRSLHETLAGGCLRVFDSEFTPVYRQGMDTAAKRDDGWTLALGTPSAAGPPRLYPATDVLWVKSDQVLQGPYKLQRPPKTGERFQIINVADGQVVESVDGRLVDYAVKPNNSFGRDHLIPGYALKRDGKGDWHILVSDSNARKKKGGYYYTLGQFGNESVELGVGVWAHFLEKVSGTNDQRPAEKKQNEGLWRKVYFANELKGERRAVSPDMWPTIVWVKVKNNLITDISTAVIWRTEGNFSAGTRLTTKELLPCSDPNDLCPSCKIFGMADTSGQSASAEQRSYASHVHFLPAYLRGNAAAAFEEKFIRGMMSPHPGFGPFYLQLDGNTYKAGRGEEPTSHWGAKPDRNGHPVRKLRGRKYYWHATPSPESPGEKSATGPLPTTELSKWHRWYTTESAADQRSRAFVDEEDIKSGAEGTQRNDGDAKDDEKDIKRHLLKADKTIQSQIVFENLTEEDLGSLIAALEPGKLLELFPELSEGREFATHLGGGKPLGLGSVRPVITKIEFWDGRRYFDDGTLQNSPNSSQSDTGWEEKAEKAVEAFKENKKFSLYKQWKSLAHVLDIHKVDPNLVWYPPGADRSHFLDADGKFDKSYEFFVATSGDFRKNDMCPLPDPTADDQTIQIQGRQ